MHSAWFKETPQSKKADRKKEIMGYKNAFDALKELLEDHFEDHTPDYNNPSWSHAQADVNGANRKLRQIINLIDLQEK